MRRKDREITDIKQLQQIMDNCECCRIGFYDQGDIYIVPLNFGYSLEGEKWTLYFHGAKAGRKFDLISTSPQVGFEMDCNCLLTTAELACEYSFNYQSIIGSGQISLVEDEQAKTEALSQIMNHYTPRDSWEFNQKMLKNTAIFKLEVKQISGKAH